MAEPCSIEQTTFITEDRFFKEFYLSSLHPPDRYTTPHGDKHDSQSPTSSAYGNVLTSPTTTNVGVAAVSSEAAYEVKQDIQ